MMVKKICNITVRKIILLLDWIVPKNKNSILFASNSRKLFSGNSKALFEVFKYDQEFTTRYTADNVESEADEYYINIKSLSGLWYFIRADILIGTHGLSDFYFDFSYRKTFIQTWHGTPLKKIGLCNTNGQDSYKKTRKHIDKVTYFLSSSNMVSSSLVRCFRIPEKKLLEIGYPRNDTLLNLKTTKELHEKYGAKKLILYAPTFRDWAPTRLFPFDDFCFSELNRTLTEQDAVLLIRAHVNESNNTNTLNTRIINFDFTQCPDVNDILPEIDLLITDYSSIYFDYLLLNRPAIFIPYDLEEYREKRGFLYDDYDGLMAGDKIIDGQEFIESIKENLNSDDYYVSRARVNKMVNFHQTEDTSRYIKEILKARYDR